MLGGRTRVNTPDPNSLSNTDPCQRSLAAASASTASTDIGAGANTDINTGNNNNTRRQIPRSGHTSTTSIGSTGRARGISHTVSLSSTQTTLNLGDEVEPASPTRIPGRHSIRNASTSSISKAANVTRTRAKSTASNSSIALGKPDKLSQPSAGSTGAACARATSKRSSRSSIASIATTSTITSTTTATTKSRVNKSTTSITGVPKSTNSTTANSGTRKATSTTAASRSTTKLTTQSKTNLAGDKPTSKSSSIASAKTIKPKRSITSNNSNNANTPTNGSDVSVNKSKARTPLVPQTRATIFGAPVIAKDSKPRARPATSANSTTSTPRVTANKGNTVKSNSSGKNANKSTTSVASVKSVSAKTAVSAPMHARSSSGQSARSVKSITRPIRPTSTITPTPPTRITTTNATTNTTALKAPKSTRTKPSKGGNGSNTITNLQSSSSSSLSQIPRLSSKSTPSAKASNNSGRIRSATTTNSHGASNNTRQKSKIESTRKSINSSNNNNTDTNATLITPPHSASGSSKSPVLPPSNIPVLSKSIGTQRASPHRRQGSYPIDPNDTTLTSALAIARRNAAGGGGSGANAHPTRTSSPISARGNLTRKPPNLKIDTNSRLSVNSQSMSRQGSDDKRHNGSSRGVARPRPLRTLSGHPTLSPDGGERQPRSSFRFKTPPATPTSARSFPAADPFSDAESAPGEFGRAIRNWTTGNPDDSHAETSQSNRYREPPEYERVARVFGWRGGVLAATAADSEDTDDKEVDIDVWSGIDTASMGGQQQSRRRRHRSQQRKPRKHGERTDTDDADTERDDAEPTDGDASDSGMAKSILRRLRRRATSRLSEFEADQRMQRARSPSNVETDDDLLANASFRSDDAHDAIVSDQEPGSARDERRPVSPSSRHSENRWRWPRSLTKSQNFDQREAGPASPGPSSFPSLPDLHRAKSTRQLPDTSSARLGPNMEQRSSSVGHQRRKLSVSVVQYDPTPIAHDLIPPVPAIPPEYLPGGGVTAATRSSIAQQRLDRKKTHRRTTSQASRASKYSAPSVDLDRDDDLLLLDPTIFDRIYEDDLQSVWADITLSETNTATNSQLSGSVKSPHSRVASESFSTVSSRSSLGHRRASLNDVAEQVATRPSLTSDRVSFTSMDPAPIASSSKRLLVASTPEKMVYILTTQMDYTFMVDFFFTYRSFMTPLALCQLLVARFRWALIQPQSDDVERRVVRIRLYVVLRHWLLDHYTTDFHKSRPVRRHLARFLDTLPEHPVIQASQRDHRIMQQLRRLFRRLRMYHRRSARTRAPINGDLLVLRHTMYEDATQQTSHHQHSASHSGSFSSSIIAIIQRPSNESADSAARATTTGSTSIGPRQRPQLYDIPSIPMMNTSVEPADSTRYVYAGTFLLPPLAFKVLPPLPTKQLPSLPYEQYDKKPLPILPQDEEKLAVSTVYSSSGNSDDDDSSYRRRRTPHHRRHRHMPSITSGLASDVCSITSVESRAGPDGLSPKMPHRQTLQRPTSTPSLHRFLTGNQSDSTINVQHPRYLAQQQRYPNPLANATTRVFRMNEARNTIRNKRHTFPKRKLSQLAITIDDTEPGAWRRTMTTALLGEVARVKRGVAGSVRARMRKRTISSSIEICNCGWQDPHDNALANANANANATTTIQNDHVMSSNDTDDDDDNLPSEVLTPPKSDSSSNNNNKTCQSDSAITSAVRSPLRHQIRATPESSLNNDDNDNGNDDDDDDDGKQHHSDPTMMITPPTPMDDANEHQSDEVKTNEIALDANETEIIQPHAQPNVSVSRKNSRRYRPRRASRLSATASAARDTLRRAHGSWRNHRLNLRRRSTRGQSITTCPNCACLLPMGSQEEIDAIRRRWHTVGSDEIGEKAGMILEYRSEMVAAACCVIESEVLRAIHWRDLLDVSWNRAPTSAGDRTSGVRRLIDRFNSFTQWVVSEIVSVTTVDKRARLIEKYIRVALKCYLFGNFTTVLQILLGLQSPAVERLTRTWSRVDAYERRVLNELQTLSNPARNWAVLRRAMEKHAEKMLAADPQDQGGCLPFLGIYLSDLVYNTELPSYVDYNLQPVNIQEVLGWQSSGSLHTNITPSTCSTTGGQSSSGYDRSLDTASTLNGSISGSTHSRNRSLGGQSIAPALAAVMLVNRSPARKRGISNCSNYSDPNGVIRVFTGQETDIESSSNNNDHHHHHQSDPSNAHSILSSSTTVTPLVNYHRHRNTANVLRRVMAYQLLAARFTMELDVELRTCLEQLHCLDNPTVNALSREREPPPARVIASVPHITPERSASRRTTIVDH